MFTYRPEPLCLPNSPFLCYKAGEMIQTGRENKATGKFVQKEIYVKGKQTKEGSKIPSLRITKELWQKKNSEVCRCEMQVVQYDI